MLEDAKIIELFFARSEFAIKELDTKYGKVCYGIAYNPPYNLIQTHCNVYKFVCSTKLIHRFLHEKYALMRVLLIFHG